VDYEGTQYWSDVISIIPHEENSIDLQLDLLADLTNDPKPVRFDGVPPVYEPEKVMVASLGSIRGLLLHSIVGQTTGDQSIYYFINDHLGTPQKLLNKNADVVWSADYKPFGDADVYVNTFANNFRFPGQYYDQETGLHYNWNRYYDPNVGRYLRADPIGLAGGINLFAYVLNNPINMFDPEGLQAETKIIGKWFRKPYLENMNVFWQDGKSWYNSFNWDYMYEKIYKHKFGYLNVKITGDVGFTVYCKEVDNCDIEIRHWYVERNWSDVSKDVRIPIKINLLPKNIKNLLLGKKIFDQSENIKYFKKMIPLLDKTPTEICKNFPNG